MNCILRSLRKGGLQATVSCYMKGTYASWPIGEKVTAWKDKDGTYTIERNKWFSPEVPIMHQLTCVPKEYLNLP